MTNTNRQTRSNRGSRAKRWSTAAAGVTVWILLGAPTHAVDCVVPASFPTVQAAVDDPSCTVVQVSSAIDYAELVTVDRSLSLESVDDTDGRIPQLNRLHVTGPSTVVALDRLEFRSACERTLWVTEGARATATRTLAVHDLMRPCVGGGLFEDGFESGDTAAWSSTAP